jgi:hypothetical protein
MWGIFDLLDPDPDPADQTQCGSGTETHLFVEHEHEHYRRTLQARQYRYTVKPTYDWN